MACETRVAQSWELLGMHPVVVFPAGEPLSAQMHLVLRRWGFGNSVQLEIQRGRSGLTVELKASVGGKQVFEPEVPEINKIMEH